MIELLSGYLYIIIYIILLLPEVLFFRMKAKIENEMFRKMLHFILLGIIPIWLYVYVHWWIAVLACVGIVLIAFPLLTLAEKISWCSDFLIERKKGEFKSSLIIVFVMFAIVIIVCWGILNDKWLAFISIYAWGPGDAAAALVGKRFGKHKINLKAIGGKKSLEGSVAMFATSFVCVFVMLFIFMKSGMNIWQYIIITLIVAFVSAVIELFSKNGNDTINCPIGAMITLIIMLHILGGI